MNSPFYILIRLCWLMLFHLVIHRVFLPPPVLSSYLFIFRDASKCLNFFYLSISIKLFLISFCKFFSLYFLIFYENLDETGLIYVNQDGIISSLNREPLKLEGQFIYHGSNISSTFSNVNGHISNAWSSAERLMTI